MSRPDMRATRMIGVVRPRTGMIRTVINEADAANPNNGLPNSPDDYKTRLLKYIPAEAIVLYLALIGIVTGLEEQSPFWYWVGSVAVFVGGLVAVPLILIRGYGMQWRYKIRQIIISTVAYVLWVVSVGTLQGMIQVPPAIVTVTLGLYTFFAPFIDPGTNTSGVA
jgi:hypothetical protein